jgi:hypothetical protein
MNHRKTKSENYTSQHLILPYQKDLSDHDVVFLTMFGRDCQILNFNLTQTRHKKQTWLIGLYLYTSLGRQIETNNLDITLTFVLSKISMQHIVCNMIDNICLLLYISSTM